MTQTVNFSGDLMSQLCSKQARRADVRERARRPSRLAPGGQGTVPALRRRRGHAVGDAPKLRRHGFRAACVAPPQLRPSGRWLNVS